MVYNSVSLIAIAVLYKLVPILMCYSVGINEATRNLGFSYDSQFAVGALISIILGTIILSILFKDVVKWNKILEDKEIDNDKVRKIREKCISLPYKVYFCQNFAFVFSAGI